MQSSAFFAGLAAGAGLIVAIGAQNAFVLRQGLQRRHVGVVVLVCVAADIALILLGIAGMGAAVTREPGLLQLLRIAGGVFLLGYGLLAVRRAIRGDSGLQPAGSGAVDRRGVVIACLGFTLLNPHVYLDTVVLLGSLSTHYAGPARWAFAGGASVASLAWFTALGYGARVLLPVFRNPVAWRVFDLLIAAFLLLLASQLLVPSSA